MAEDSRSDVIKLLENAECGLFSHRDSTDEAFEYAMSLARVEGVSHAVMTLAIMVYHNTLVRTLKEKVNELQTT